MNQPVVAVVSLDQRFAANSSGHPRVRAAETDRPVWSWEWDATGRFTRLEGPAGLIPCFSLDTVLGARLCDLPFLNMAAADWAAWRQATACGAALGPLDLLCAMPAGRPVWVRLNGSAISDAAPEAGGMAGYAGTFEDITCAMLAKSSPATREAALQEMLDALGIQVCALDREGRIAYADYVSDQMQEPDYDAAVAAVRTAAG